MIALLLPFLLANMAAVADRLDPCRADLLAASPGGKEGYKRRGAYCEGVISEPISGSFVLIGFRLGAQPSQLQQYVNVTLPSFVNAGRDQVRLQGTSKLLGTPYRLDAYFSPAGEFRWDLEIVLSSLRISSGDIGLVGIRHRDLADVLIPVEYGRNRPPDVNTTAVLVLRAPEDMGPLQFRLRGSQSSAWITLYPDGIDLGQTVEIPVPVAAVISGVTIDVRADTLEQPPSHIVHSLTLGPSGP